MITPIEIQGKMFKTGIGYDKKDVEAFLKEVQVSYEQLYKENVELNDKIGVLSEGIQYYKTIEKTLQKALVLAEKTSEETRNNALTEAKTIEKEARAKAKEIVQEAKRELDETHLKTLTLIQQYEKYKVQFKALTSTQLELLESDTFSIQLASVDSMIDTFGADEGKEGIVEEDVYNEVVNKTTTFENMKETAYEEKNTTDIEEAMIEVASTEENDSEIDSDFEYHQESIEKEINREIEEESYKNDIQFEDGFEFVSYDD